MDLSVVVPTLNGRDRLAACLDALAANAPDAEVIVVNGPSADGTTGMVRDRDDVDVLVEISDRTVNVARNAGIEVATGDAVALVDYDNRIEPGWRDAVADGLDAAPVVSGPVTPIPPSAAADGDPPEGDGDRAVDGATEPERDPTEPERNRIAGRDVTYFEGGNVAFRREAVRDLDGFDEYLRVGGARDAAHRLARMDREVAWRPAMAVRKELPTPTAADGGRSASEWGWKYRALAYRLLKNYGVRPTVLLRTGSHALGDAVAAAKDVVRGESTPSRWAATGRDVVVGLTGGTSDGVVARRRDRSPARNPNGISTRADRAVAKYDRRAGADAGEAGDAGAGDGERTAVDDAR
ncbi:glycosyl transferase family 2 [Halorubrum californiense DSM 19288]|uniref:Glycosyl transferase family 2 n=1 Tax=Halorubrum californiense DSM 19288 TaxID=1227465 RepID=M0ELS1_9EURY|nr:MULTISPECIES: glycosyltransferase [Halorubrum]ELZ48013.1 glycosyl transferase family 2 [Halorubrum californiense DSM 19288]TKX68190.1 glycosyltransferase [Halorubrum sp. GN11GM_10-3_MGM]